MKSSNIKSFAVYGLFGTNDVHIPFDEDIKILVGENGLGKTQILNLFYYTLIRNFKKLDEFVFDRLEVIFEDNEICSLSKDEFLYLAPPPISKNEDWLEIFKRFTNDENEPEKKEENLSPALNKLKEIIASHLQNIEILYFPTFRRVEEDLQSLGYDESKLKFKGESNRLIHFGMEDVKARFQHIENTIDKLLKEGLAQFTKDILNVVIEDFEPSTVIMEKINAEDIELILSRVGDLLPSAQKEAVKNIVEKKQLKNPLSGYLLQKLIDIYEKQKGFDSSVKVFRDICNHYLINKKVFYDESAIKIFIKSEITGDEIALSKLSSGEKQIISIFSKIYLSDVNKRFMVLFDEPELSLSMLWQKQLLPDIIHSKKCDFLLAVTHSPFIFDNELDMYAVGLNEYVKPAKIITI